VTDPDLLAIRRKRRQQGRCVVCGLRMPRAALCTVCRQAWRWCVRCGDIVPIEQSSDKAPSRSSAYCLPCRNVVVNGPRVPRAEYLAATRTRSHPKLKTIIRLYRKGLTLPQIAAALAMNEHTLKAIIFYARKTGRWPKNLTRGKDWRRGRTTTTAALTRPAAAQAARQGAGDC
jgi:hypothetical protein